MAGSDEDYYEYEEEDYGDDDDQDDDAPTEDRFETRSKVSSVCKVITKGSLLVAQRDDIKKVMDLLSIKENNARSLLIHYRWDVEKIADVFLNNGKEMLYTEASVPIPDDGDVSLFHECSEASCEMCLQEFPVNQMTAMDCNHRYCNICWTEYFVHMINDGKCKRINCMNHNCYAICDEENIRDLVNVKNPDLAKKFDHSLLDSYIQDKKNVKWCPSVPHCGNAIQINDGDIYREVECICGKEFCFNCCSEPHSPCSCRMWELWNEKCKERVQSTTWVRKFYNRFVVNREPPIFEVRMKENLKEVTLHTESPMDYDWAIDAANIFFRSRRIVSNLYPFSYYAFANDLTSDEMKTLNQDTRQHLFNCRHQQLEGYCEKLSYFLHVLLDSRALDQINELKVQIIDLSSLIDDLCKQLYEFIDSELLQHQHGRHVHIIAPYRSNGVEKAVELVQ